MSYRKSKKLNSTSTNLRKIKMKPKPSTVKGMKKKFSGNEEKTKFKRKKRSKQAGSKAKKTKVSKKKNALEQKQDKLVQEYLRDVKKQYKDFILDDEFPTQEDMKIIISDIKTDTKNNDGKTEYFIELLESITSYTNGTYWWSLIYNDKFIYLENKFLESLWFTFKKKTEFENLDLFFDIMLDVRNILNFGVQFYVNLNNLNANLLLENAYSIENYRKIVKNKKLLSKFIVLIYFIKYSETGGKDFYLKVLKVLDTDIIVQGLNSNLILTTKYERLFNIILGYNINWNQFDIYMSNAILK